MKFEEVGLVELKKLLKSLCIKKKEIPNILDLES